ncbi:MAG: cytosolic protein [Planctomycetes bacterium]|nr:cytosolic protein [Planctomycetota bacterium]
MDCTLEKNIAACACTSETSPRRGRCCKRLKHHLASKSLPSCCFPSDGDDFGHSLAGIAKA